MPKKKIDDFLEWTTIPYRTIRFWIIIFCIIALIAGLFLLNRYAWPTKESNEISVRNKALQKKAARFISVDGDVKVKPLNSIEWVSASKIKKIYPGDIIKTGYNSSCRIAFFDGTIYELKPNSLMSILESYEDLATLKRSVNVELATGALDLATVNKITPQSKAKVETTNAVADVAEYTKASAAFDQKMKNTSFKVSKGRAKVISKKTRTVIELKENEEASVKENKIIKHVLPPPPEIISPRTSEIFTSNNPKTLKIRLRWSMPKRDYTYRVFVSTNPQFYQLLLKKDIPHRNYIVITGLPFGNYYWRVVAVDKNNTEGYPSPTGMFAIRPSRVNPSQSIKFVIDKIIIIGNILEIIGRTDPDNFVTINGKIVILNKDGTFKHFTDPFEGANVAILNIMVKDYSGAVKKIRKIINLE